MKASGRPPVMPAEDRRKEIFAAAERLLVEQGYDRVTMAAIATAAGMSKKTLYVHFANKQALLAALVASSYVLPEPPLRAASGDTGDDTDPVAALARQLRVIAAHVLSGRHLRLCRLAIGEGIGVGGLADTFYPTGIDQSRQALVAAVARIAKARRPRGLDETVLADMLFGATVGQALMDALLTGKTPDVAQAEARIGQVLSALFAA